MAFVLLSVIYSVLLFLFGVFLAYVMARSDVAGKLLRNLTEDPTEQKIGIVIGAAVLVSVFSAIYFIVFKSMMD